MVKPLDSELCQMRIGLLGTFYLEVDGVKVGSEVWKSKKALLMLKYLAARPGNKVSSDVLMELLWPDNDAIDSTSNLHTAVWFVRRVLATKETKSRLRYSNGSYWLDLSGGGCTDLEELEMHAAASRQFEESDPELALFHCEAALKLYRGDFLYEEMYEEWTIHYRDYYKELYFEITVRASDLLRKHRGDYREAVRVCKEALQKDPFREELYQACLKALIEDERYVEAINLYNHCSHLLMEEFGFEPNQTTKDIVVDMRRYLVKEEILPVVSVEAKEAPGAYNCGRAVFQAVLDIEQRRFEHSGRHFSMLIFYNEDIPNIMAYQAQEAFVVLQNSLQRSDVICQWSLHRIAIFLPETNSLEAKALSQRLERTLRSKLKNTIAFQCEILSTEYVGDMHEEFQTIVVNQ